MKKFFSIISDLYDFGGIWFFVLIFVMIALVIFTCIAIFNPCALSHLDAAAGQNFCELCGLQLRPFCSSCDSFCHYNAVFCDICGSLLESN